jgi:pantoate kinase
MEATAYSPTHITGLVIPYDRARDTLRIGSTGIGFSMQQGVTTHVEVSPHYGEIEVEINGRLAPDALVSRRTAEIILSKTAKKQGVHISHRVDVPTGVGFGTSGAAVLSLALAMNESLGLGLTRVEVAQTAHIAEVACGTGLGTVLAEMHGGFEARVKPGGPGFGQVVRLSIGEDEVVVALTFGALSTAEMLSAIKLRGESRSLGESLLQEFLRDRSVEAFLRVSNRFARFLGLSPRLIRVLDEAEGSGFVCGVALFGETAFTLVKPEVAGEVERLFRGFLTANSKVVISRIGYEGARLL